MRRYNNDDLQISSSDDDNSNKLEDFNEDIPAKEETSHENKAIKLTQE